MISSVTLRPSKPPWAFTLSAQSSYPCLNASPSAEKSPERDKDIPILIGVVPCFPVVVAPTWLLQAAQRTLVRTRAANTGKRLLSQAIPVSLIVPFSSFKVAGNALRSIPLQYSETRKRDLPRPHRKRSQHTHEFTMVVDREKRDASLRPPCIGERETNVRKPFFR